MNIAKQALLLSVKDTYRQKDLPEYNGSITVTVDNGTEFPDEMHELTLSLPKVFFFNKKRLRTISLLPFDLDYISMYNYTQLSPVIATLIRFIFLRFQLSMNAIRMPLILVERISVH